MAIHITETQDQVILEYRFTIGRYVFLIAGIGFMIFSPIFMLFFKILGFIFLLFGVCALFGAKEAGKKQILVIDLQNKEIRYKNVNVPFSEIKTIFLRALSEGGRGRLPTQIICEKNSGNTVTLLPADSNTEEKIKILGILQSKGLPVTFDTEVD